MKREKCPCCGFPTLQNRGQNEICRLCDWEDDNQDESVSAEILGGPNGDYSLKEARRNFKKNLHMYRGISKHSSMGTNEVKVRLMLAYERLEKNNQESEDWTEILKLEKELVMFHSIKGNG
ncbi:CPCC family cysteine-rich protein [Planococcus sp. FY231025]|uniref:CPCC family cysteine-rich protein n=1 Tax=Planococcus sp. FY231025 TaxID=3455699 RepID=UPI003F93A611